MSQSIDNQLEPGSFNENVPIDNDQKQSLFFRQVKAIFWRRYISYTHPISNILRTTLLPLLFTFFGIAFLIITVYLSRLTPEEIKFQKDTLGKDHIYALVGDGVKCDEDFSQSIKDIIKEDTGYSAICHHFSSISDFNVYSMEVMKSSNETLLIGFHFPSNDLSNVTVLYNNTGGSFTPSEADSIAHYHRALWRHQTKGTFSATVVQNIDKTLLMALSSFLPFFLLFGLFLNLSVVSSLTISDTKKKKRDYMLTCKLKYTSFWCGSFIFDYMIWFIVSALDVIILVVYEIVADSKLLISPELFFFTLVFSGMTMIILSYCLSFIFDEPQTGASYISLIISIPLILAYVIQTAVKDTKIVNIIMAIIPVADTFSLISPSGFDSLVDIRTVQKLFSDPNSRLNGIFLLLHPFILIFVLYLVEILRKKRQASQTVSQFANYQNIFAEKKTKFREYQLKKFPSLNTKLVNQNQMDFEVNQNIDYALFCNNVSRIYFDSASKPITAVNQASFGVERNTIFGFLGLNGAGKTTLLKIITNEIPLSNGSFQINSQNGISICPQFNDHLTEEMTPYQLIKFFIEIKGLPKSEYDRAIQWAQEMRLTEHCDKLVKELSGGNARKTCVLLSFLTEADIILLDEPTSSLDPVARRNVHDLIQLQKENNHKTIMLCTHLLDEAEELCDKISMMVNGCILDIDTPQGLSSRYGGIIKLDLLLKEDYDFEVKQQLMDDIHRSFLESPAIVPVQNSIVFTYPIRSTPDEEIASSRTKLQRMRSNFSFIQSLKEPVVISGSSGEVVRIELTFAEDTTEEQQGSLVEELQKSFSSSPDIREKGNNIDFSMSAGENPNLVLLKSLEHFERLYNTYNIVKFFTGCSSSLEKAFLEMAEIFSEVEQETPIEQ